VHTIAACLLAAFLSAPLPGVAREVFYGGSSTVAATVLRGGVARGLEERTGIKVRVVDVSGTGKGLEALAQGKLDVSGAGRPLTDAEKRAGLVGTIVGHDALAVYVNRKNPLKDLREAQLRDILTGKARSWKELGGRDVAVVPLIEPVASGRATVSLLQELVLGGEPFAPEIRELDLLRDQLAEVARSEGAICVASVGFLASLEPDVRDGVRAISLDATPPTDANIQSGAYPISRPLLLVTKGPPSGDTRALIDYVLSADGQAVVEKYLVPVAKR
jgi:phosphate transport system substrate-binding protein